MQKLLLLLSFLPCFLFASIPTGYYSTANGKTGAALKTALHKIICNDTTGYLSYGSGAGHTWEGFYSTDRNLSNNSVIDMYSNEIRYFPDPNPTFASFGQTIQIEHSLPKSWWGGYEWAAFKDLNHLYPSDGTTNNIKSNYPLGVVTGTITLDNGVSKIGNATYTGYSGKVFEPADQYKGDFARSYFYMATTYENYANYWNSPMMDKNTYPVFNQWATDLLLEWSRNDEVSEKENTRTNVVYSFQHNRNPFIDYPELAEYIWGYKVGLAWNSTVTSLYDNNIKIHILLNSTNNYFTVESTETNPIAIAIYSIDGKKILQTKATTNTQIQITDIQTGIYIFEIETNNSVIRQKQIISK